MLKLLNKILLHKLWITPKYSTFPQTIFLGETLEMYCFKTSISLRILQFVNRDENTVLFRPKFRFEITHFNLLVELEN
jgi:hypothetical protein